MSAQWILTIVGLISAGAVTTISGVSTAQSRQRLNPVIELLEQKQPVFGLYAPSNRRAGGGRGGAQPPVSAEPLKTPAQLAQDAVGFKASDFVFDGTMEGDFDRAYPVFAAFMKAMVGAGALQKMPFLRLHHPIIVKTPKIADDPALATERIGRQLDLGASGIVFVGVESAIEVEIGLAAMRLKSVGGTRPDDVGSAPAFWGMSDAEYRDRAGVWPLDPKGELINWTIVESKEGLARVREIAAVKGIGVLFPGAGTLRRAYTTTGANGQRVFDEQGWEAAIQQVLAACKEFNVPCGYPATADDIELRMKQGFSVFIMNWGDQGFRAIELGRRAAARPD